MLSLFLKIGINIIMFYKLLLSRIFYYFNNHNIGRIELAQEICIRLEVFPQQD